jgi:hypothetical protein
VPAGLSNVVAISAGDAHSLALQNDGTVVAWGDIFNSSGWAPEIVPTGLSNVVAISAGYDHSLALKNDGTVVAWGDNNDGLGNFCGQSVVPAGLSNVVAISAGGYHSLALKNDGTVVAWGYNGDGECTVPAGLNGVVAIAAGGHYSMVLAPYVPVAIQNAPPSQTAYLGSTIDFTAYAAGYPPPYYLWFVNGTNLVCCSTNYDLELTNVQFSQSGAYTVVISNVLGAVTSAPVMLNVIPPVERRLVRGTLWVWITRTILVPQRIGKRWTR